MISQNCPKCSSSRIRPGYRPTPLWSKILFRYNLLCDSCNWEFRGFAVPGTVNRKKPKKIKPVAEVEKKAVPEAVIITVDNIEATANHGAENKAIDLSAVKPAHQSGQYSAKEKGVGKKLKSNKSVKKLRKSYE